MKACLLFSSSISCLAFLILKSISNWPWSLNCISFSKILSCSSISLLFCSIFLSRSGDLIVIGDCKFYNKIKFVQENRAWLDFKVKPLLEIMQGKIFTNNS